MQDGITIDLGEMNQVTVSKDRTITSVGGGARWEDVYLKLDAMDLAVSGGRVYDVGVGGLTSGGGNSFFAPRFGFVCDNVERFEVGVKSRRSAMKTALISSQIVTGLGLVVNTSESENPDLHKALKGGSNNFGIITRFDLKTFQQGKLWGGFIIYPPTTATEQFELLQNFTTASGAGEDPYATVINSYIFTPKGFSYIANQYTYTKAEAYPAILKNFTDVQPQLSNTMRITNLTNITIELGQGTPNGFRQLFGTATFANNASLFSEIFSIAQTAFLPIQTVKDFQASFVLQPIPTSITDKGALTGGNSLGIDESSGNLVWLDLTIQWSETSDDVAVNNATQYLLTQAIQYAKSKGQHNEYLYLNYAMQSQDPIASYGVKNVAAMQAVSSQHDPDQVFQNMVPGGFKMNRTSATCC
ncbi:hypothetical protein MMC12_003357 [Toensbergia leucococca]|nr:hypothetical protein [Toensbergia leucococca]